MSPKTETAKKNGKPHRETQFETRGLYKVIIGNTLVKPLKHLFDAEDNNTVLVVSSPFKLSKIAKLF